MKGMNNHWGLLGTLGQRTPSMFRSASIPKASPFNPTGLVCQKIQAPIEMIMAYFVIDTVGSHTSGIQLGPIESLLRQISH